MTEQGLREFLQIYLMFSSTTDGDKVWPFSPDGRCMKMDSRRMRCVKMHKHDYYKPLTRHRTEDGVLFS